MLGKSVTYQVDAEPTLSWLPNGDNEGESAMIIQQMLHGQRIEARYLSFEGDPLEIKLGSICRLSEQRTRHSLALPRLMPRCKSGLLRIKATE